MSLPTASLAETLLNKLILVDFFGAIRVKCEKCFNSWWNCLEMTQELKKKLVANMICRPTRLVHIPMMLPEQKSK